MPFGPLRHGVVGRGWFANGRDVILYAADLIGLLEEAARRDLVLLTDALNRTYQRHGSHWCDQRGEYYCFCRSKYCFLRDMKATSSTWP